MTPGFIRRRTLLGGVINGVEEPWTLGYLIDVILTRDPWMHRLDICTALDRTPHLTADHNGVIVADVVGEWAGRHGKDFALHLTGPAGGTWTAGTAGPRIELNAVELAPVAEPEIVARTVSAVLQVREEPERPARHPGRGGRRPLPAGGPGQPRARARRGRQAGRRLMRSCPQACLLVTSREPPGSAGSASSGFPHWPSRPLISPTPAGWLLSSRCSCSRSAP